MAVREIKEGIHAVGANDWSRRLFDELIPLPDGTSYNSYLIRTAGKTVLIDTVDPTKTQELLANLNRAGVGRLDYIVANHAEQDHSGSIPRVLEAYPESKVVTNPKCKEFLKSLMPIPDDRFIAVNDRETLPLGGKTLEFIYAAWVHWPETMLTYLREDAVLFTCDLFGSHLATTDLFAVDEMKVYESAKRYYAEIMMPFRSNIVKHMEKLKAVKIDVIAPSHGPVYNRPPFILDAYRDWISDNVKNEVVLPYVSMHGSTAAMVAFMIETLVRKGVAVRPFDLPRTDLGELAKALVDAATIVIACPTVLVGPHPSAVYAAFLANALRPKTKFASIVGSYGWGGQMLERIQGLLSNLEVTLIEPVMVRGFPREADFQALERLCDDIYKKHQEAKAL